SGAWYIIAINSEGEYRNFRCSRIINLSVLNEHFIRPDDFVLSDYWKSSKMNFIQALPEFEVEVKISRNIIERIMFTDRFARLQQLNHNESNSDWVKVKISFPTKEEAINFTLGFGNQIKLLTPKELQTELLARVQE